MIKKTSITSEKLRIVLPGIIGPFEDPLNRTYKSQSKIESRMKIVDSLTFVWINFFLSNLHGYVNVPKQMIQHLGDSGLLLFSLPFFLFLS